MEHQERDPCELSAGERLSLWRSRSLRHRLEHRWNVTRLLLGGSITLRTAWFGLMCAHLAVALAVRPPARGMVIVCPAAAQEYFAHEADESLKLWKSRSWRHKLEHRWNVLSGFFLMRLKWCTALRAMRFPHEAAFLTMRSPRRSMLVVCPVALRELEQIRQDMLSQFVSSNSLFSSTKTTSYDTNLHHEDEGCRDAAER